jgi:ubiquitin-protein ligase
MSKHTVKKLEDAQKENTFSAENRIYKELVKLREEPIPYCAAGPVGDDVFNL